MSLCEQLRTEAVQHHSDELTRLRSSHSRDLRTLRAIYDCVHNNTGLSSLLTSKLALEDISDDDTRFLEKNQISTGFDPTELTWRSPPHTPSPQHDAASIYAAKPTSASVDPPQHAQRVPGADVLTTDVAAVREAPIDALPDSGPTSTVQVPASGLPDLDASLPVSQNASLTAFVELDGPNAAPLKIAPPAPEEEASISARAQQFLDQQQSTQPAKTVHLPPKEVQEEQLRQREAAEEHHKQSDVDARTSHRVQASQNEVASSPSSTVGAYSAATPQPPQDSPDTSPDSEAALTDVLPPKELQPSPEQQREKEEHDRLLQAQKEMARRQALGDLDVSPDEQLKWEEREAAAREAEERAAREDVGGPEPDVKKARDSTAAEQVVEDMQVNAAPAIPADPVQAGNSGQISEGGHLAIPEAQDDADTIAVASRKPSLPPPIETRLSEAAEEASQHSTHAQSRAERMTTRVSSGALRQKSVSEILGNPQSPLLQISPSSRKEVLSPEAISPLTQRHPADERARPESGSQALGQPRMLPLRTNSTADSALDQLESLKGAAQDPERDYLEPLFRIQAHESANSGTKTLPDLIRMVPKALSTDDHFTSLHERLDFRMLRRIYQLQNANKWSLRQMEKCKEPEQQVTHHDHMMEEMRWIRKDFQAERKMKRSVCAWLAQRCAEWVAADGDDRKRLQGRFKMKKAPRALDTTELVPDLDHAGDSPTEDDNAPLTPRPTSPLHTTVVIAPELQSVVEDLQKAGRIEKAFAALPKTGTLSRELKHSPRPVTLVSRFIEGKVLPKSIGPSAKRSRYDYEDEAEVIGTQQNNKRRRGDDYLPPEDQLCALFDPENKQVRDRLHSNNAFRPPSEFVMPSTQFYEFRSGSQWIWEDDQKLRKLAKDYSFNWSLIADEMTLPTRYKSSAERRTPWECFERWVELESLPADMRKTVYFKTWFQRLEQSQQAAERRYQVQVTALQQQAAQTGAQAHIPIRRRTVPTRVEKRRSTRYLWMVDGFRKLAKKREQAAWKQAETARAAAQRKTQSEANQVKTVKMTPQEFSKKRQERDQQIAEAHRVARANMIEAQRQRQMALARGNQPQQPQQAGQNGVQAQQRPQGPTTSTQQGQMQTNGQQAANVNGQTSGQQQLRPGVPMAPQLNGHLAPPQASALGIPQAQMQARAGMVLARQTAVPQNTVQGNAQFPSQQFPVQSGNISSPGGNFTTQQQLQQNQALLQAFQQQRQVNGGPNPGMNQNAHSQQVPASPSMPPPPTPQNAPQQLSSGHVPQIIAIQNQLRATNPGLSEEQLKAMATQQMKAQSQSSSQVRQNAMNAAAGISPQQSHAGLPQQYNQGAYQRNSQQAPNGMNGLYNMPADGVQQASMSPVNGNSSPSQQMYAQKMLQRQQLQMQQLQMHQMQMHSPNTSHAQVNGSPSVAHASPSMAPASPSMQFSNMNPMGPMGTPVLGMNGQQRPPSRSVTPQMRLGSSGSGVAGNGMQSPGALQGSPRNMQANMAR